MKQNSFTAIFLMLISTLGFAQGWGIETGLNFSKMQWEDIEGDVKLLEKSGQLTGLKIGITYEFKLGGNFYAQPGLFYNRKGGIFTDTDWEEENASYSLKLNFLDIPVQLTYKYPLNEDVALFLHATPYLSIGMGGTDEECLGNTCAIYKVKFVNTFDTKMEEEQLQLFNFGGGAGFGMTFKNFYAKFEYYHHFTNLVPPDPGKKKSDYTERLEINMISLSIGYRLKK